MAAWRIWARKINPIYLFIFVLDNVLIYHFCQCPKNSEKQKKQFFSQAILICAILTNKKNSMCTVFCGMFVNKQQNKDTIKSIQKSTSASTTMTQ